MAERPFTCAAREQGNSAILAQLTPYFGRCRSGARAGCAGTHLSHYSGAKKLGHGVGYEYAHDGKDHFVAQDYLGVGKIYYEPTEQGVEKKIKERVDKWRAEFSRLRGEKKRKHSQNRKAELRSMIRTALESISPAVRAVESEELCARLKLQLPSAGTILFFAPLANEIDVWPLLEESVKRRGKSGGAAVVLNPPLTYRKRRVENPADECHRKIWRARTGCELRGSAIEQV